MVRELCEALAGAHRRDFRVVHVSVQRDHVHLLVEGDDARALREGLQALSIRLAHAVNRALARRGSVWRERHHRRALAGPRAVRAALLYVLQNGQKHGVVAPGELDPCSSAAHLWGFTPAGEALRLALVSREAESALARVLPVVPPRTWLLRLGWILRGGGLLDPRESPAPPRTRRRLSPKETAPRPPGLLPEFK